MQLLQQKGCSRSPVTTGNWFLVAYSVSDLRPSTPVWPSRYFVYCAAMRSLECEFAAECVGANALSKVEVAASTRVS